MLYFIASRFQSKYIFSKCRNQSCHLIIIESILKYNKKNFEINIILIKSFVLNVFERTTFWDQKYLPSSGSPPVETILFVVRPERLETNLNCLSLDEPRIAISLNNGEVHNNHRDY